MEPKELLTKRRIEKLAEPYEGIGEIPITLFFCVGYTDDFLYGAGEEVGVCGGGDIECGWGWDC